MVAWANYEDVIKGVGDPQEDEVRCGRRDVRRSGISRDVVKLTDKTLHVEHGHSRFPFVCPFCPLMAIAWRTDTNCSHKSPQSTDPGYSVNEEFRMESQRFTALVLVLGRLSCSVLTSIREQSSADDALSWGQD